MTRSSELKEAVEFYEALIANYTKVREELIVRRRSAADHVMVEIDQRLEVNARAIEAYSRALEAIRKYLTLIEGKGSLGDVSTIRVSRGLHPRGRRSSA